MAEPTKLSVEKALAKMRESDLKIAKEAQLDDKSAALNDEIRRMKAQRQRLERKQGKRD